MNTFLKRKRIDAGLTQAELAEKMQVSVVAVQNWESGKTKINPDRYADLSIILNVPVDTLIKEMIMDEDKTRNDNWPDFLFDEDTNNLVSTLHLNMAQQDLFGLLYIYVEEFREYEDIGRNSFDEYLNRIPYGYIERVGSIQFMNQSDTLYRVLKYVRTEYLMKVLKLNPDSEFVLRKLPKSLICDFIDWGHKETDICEECFEERDQLHFDFSMNQAKIILPLLEKYGPIHLCDEYIGNPIREEIPKEMAEGIYEVLGTNKEAIKVRGYVREGYTGNVAWWFPKITDYREKVVNGKTQLIWEINDKGRELWRWFNNEEEKSNKKEKHRSSN